MLAEDKEQNKNKDFENISSFVLKSLAPVVDIAPLTLFVGLDNRVNFALRDIFYQLEDDGDNILFIPYQRSGLVYLYEQLSIKDMLLYKLNDKGLRNYMFHFINAKEKIKRNEIKEGFILDIISTFINGKVTVTEEGWLMIEEGNVLVNPELYTTTANEILNLLIPLIDLQTPSYVLIEYPEAYIHPSYQILLTLTFLSLVQHGYKFIITSNSELIMSFLGDLVRYNMNKEQIVNVVKKLLKLESLPPIVEKIIEEAEKTIKEINPKAYYFENDTVKEITIKELSYTVSSFKPSFDFLEDKLK